MGVHGVGQDIAVAGGTCVVGAGAVAAAAPADDTGPILAFVGALLVAGLAAYTAQRRQTASLAAEHERLAEQLQHDRQLTDVADLRATLEDALGAADAVLDALSDLRSATGLLAEITKARRAVVEADEESDRGAGGEKDDDEKDADENHGERGTAGVQQETPRLTIDRLIGEQQDKKDDALNAVSRGVKQMSHSVNQLQIRLDDDDPILMAYRSLTAVLDDLQEPAFDGDKPAFEEKRPAFNKAYRAFVEAAKNRVRTRAG